MTYGTFRVPFAFEYGKSTGKSPGRDADPPPRQNLKWHDVPHVPRHARHGPRSPVLVVSLVGRREPRRAAWPVRPTRRLAR